MKILIIAHNDVAMFKSRRELFRELLKEHEVYLCLPDGEFVDKFREYGCRYIETPLERRGMNPISDAKLFGTYLRIIRKIKPDLVITYSIKPNVYGGLAARIAGVPYGVNITGLGSAFQGGGLLRRIVVNMYRLGCRRARSVFFENSDNMKVFLDERIIREEQACLVSGAGVNLENYQVTEHPEDETLRFIYVGRVMQEKGIDELFEAMSMLHDDGVDCTLDVVGDCVDDMKRMSLIEEYSAQGWLRHHGFQSDIRPFIAKSHCGVLPSWHEGMANTNLELAASGRPLITSDIPGCREAVEDGVTGYLCVSRNVNSLYQAMKRMADLTRGERVEMGLAGRRRMEARFDRNKVIAKVKERLLQADNDWRED